MVWVVLGVCYSLQTIAAPGPIDAGEDQTICSGSIAYLTPTVAEGYRNRDGYVVEWYVGNYLTNPEIFNDEPIGIGEGVLEVSPTETTDYTVALSDNIGFRCADVVTVKIISMVVHPIASDFTAGKEGRILISTYHDDSYYTNAITTIAGTTAQTEANTLPTITSGNTQITITAHLTPALEAINKPVYFRVVDPDDASSYEPNTDGNDNAGGAGILSAQQVTAVAATINGQAVAAAEVTLTITNQYSGDNYRVEASLDENFTTCLQQTVDMVAWKRCYLEVDYMYKYGATILQSYATAPTTDGENVLVDNTADFNVGDQVTFFTNAIGASPPIIRTATVTGKDATHLQTTNIIDGNFPQYSGIKISNNNETFPLPYNVLSDEGYTATQIAYGNTTNGNDGGTFVEFKTMSAAGNVNSKLPKYTAIPVFDINTADDYASSWSDNTLASVEDFNLFHVIASNYDDSSIPNILGVTYQEANLTFIFSQKIIAYYDTLADPFIRSAVVHELGHQMGVANGHVDAPTTYVANHDNTDSCVMTYIANQFDWIIEFDTICISNIKSNTEPR